MGLFAIEDPSLLVTHLLYKAALVYTLLRWVLTWALKFRERHLSLFPSSSPPSEPPEDNLNPCDLHHHMMLATYGDLSERLAFPESCDACAVCLTQLNDEDEVSLLRNCCHVFHRDCIDKWVGHDRHENHRACPLCRTPMMMQSDSTQMSSGWPSSQPSWAVERMLYLFGDDLF